jgi:RNA polymerase sigma factor (sigma-70 family)
MKKYNIQNYVRYKNDLSSVLKAEKYKNFREQIIIENMYLVEEVTRRFSTEAKYIGILNLEDLLQEGHNGLIQAVDKIDWAIVDASTEPDKTLNSFLSKRIKGTIRRAINNSRTNMRVPESEMNRLKKKSKETNDDEELINQFLKAIFLQLDNENEYGESYINNIVDPDTVSEPVNNEELNKMIFKHLNEKEQVVIKRSYGIMIDKMKAKEIALEIGLKGENSQVRISEIKRDAIRKLYNNLDKNNFIKFL